MSLFADHLLSLVVFVPLLGAIIALSFPRTEHSGVRGFAIVVSLIDLALAIWMWLRFDPSVTGLQLTEAVEWIPTFGISYSVGVDGIAVLLVVLTTFLAPLVFVSTYSSVTARIREYVVCMLLLQSGILGAFLASDLFLFYVFWELMLIPMYFLIGIWGGQRRIYAALKFFLYTMAGSLLMLVAILYSVWAVRDAGGLTFSWVEVSSRLAAKPLGDAETWLFLAFAVAFAIKVPLFPFHTWLPDAHVEAPTGGSVVLAGVLLKLGTFGFLRYAFWMFPRAAAEFLPALGLIAVIGIIYGALVAMVQEDLKRLVAYSSVSHLGFVVLGMAAMTVMGVTGGVVQMVNHGISTGALFFLVGVIYERRHTRRMADFGGLAKVMPWYAFIWGVIAMSSIGVPGLNGFVGEFLVLVGTFQSTGIAIASATGDVAWAGIIAAMLVAAGAVALLGFALMRPSRERIGLPTKVLVLLLAGAGAVVVTAPPVGGFPGGLLVRPLAGVVDSGAAFGEVFAALAVIAASGVIFAAVYLLWATQRVFFGPLNHHANEDLEDLSAREFVVLMPLVIVAIVLGVYPKPVLDAVEPTVTVYAAQMRSKAAIAPMASVAGVRPAAETGEPPIRPQPAPPSLLHGGPARAGGRRPIPPGLQRLLPRRPNLTPRNLETPIEGMRRRPPPPQRVPYLDRLDRAKRPGRPQP